MRYNDKNDHDDANRKSDQRDRDPISGDCDLCGEWSSRLIEAICPPCRSQYHLDRPKRNW